MKIVHIITGLNTGGAESMLEKLVIESVKHKASHIVVSLMDEGTIGPSIAKNSTLYCLGMRSGQSTIKSFWKLYKFISKESPDVIQGWMYHGNLAAFIINLFFRKKLTWNIRCSIQDLDSLKTTTRYLVYLSKYLSLWVDKIVFNSKLSMEQHEAIGFNKEKSLLIENGFNIAKFKPYEGDEFDIKKSLDISTDAIIFGHVARYHPIKNHIVDDFKSVISKYPNSYCIMIGRDVEPSNIELYEAIERTGKAQHYFMLGECKNLVEFYSQFDFLISSSLSEGFPNVLGEAMACGTPCIVSDAGDSRVVVGKYGFSYPVQDRGLFLNAIDQAYETTETEYKALSKACRKRIVDEFSIESIYQKYSKYYMELF